MPRAKTELVIIHTDKDGNETRHKVKNLKKEPDIEYQVEWVRKAVDFQEWDDRQPRPGMESGCW